jgi:hypothetical protein
MEYHVPRLLWENFEEVLMAHSRKYVCELAKRLHVPEKELLQKVLPSSDSVKLHMCEPQSATHQCKAYLQHHALTVFCKKPVAYHSDYCIFHRNDRMLVVDGCHPVTIERVKDLHTMEPLWIMGSVLINAKGHHVGRIHKERQVITRWIFEDPLPSSPSSASSASSTLSVIP